MVANTPAPTTWVTLIAAASHTPRPRASCGSGRAGSGSGVSVMVAGTLRVPWLLGAEGGDGTRSVPATFWSLEHERPELLVLVEARPDPGPVPAGVLAVVVVHPVEVRPPPG